MLLFPTSLEQFYIRRARGLAPLYPCNSKVFGGELPHLLSRARPANNAAGKLFHKSPRPEPAKPAKVAAASSLQR